MSPREAGRRQLSFLGAATWTFGASLLLALSVQINDAARPGARTDLVSVTACYVLSYSAILLVMLRLYAPFTPVRRVLGVRWVSPLGILGAALSGAAAYPALSTLDEFILRRYPQSSEEQELLEKLYDLDSHAKRVFAAFALMLAMPLCLEVFFRGMVFGSLRRGRPAYFAVVGVIGLFALSNGDPRSLPGLLLLGAALTAFRSFSGSVVPSAVAHVAYWAVPLVPLALGRAEADIYPRTWIYGGAAGAVLLAFGASLVFRHDARSAFFRLEDRGGSAGGDASS